MMCVERVGMSEEWWVDGNEWRVMSGERCESKTQEENGAGKTRAEIDCLWVAFCSYSSPVVSHSHHSSSFTVTPAFICVLTFMSATLTHHCRYNAVSPLMPVQHSCLVGVALPLLDFFSSSVIIVTPRTCCCSLPLCKLSLTHHQSHIVRHSHPQQLIWCTGLLGRTWFAPFLLFVVVGFCFCIDFTRPHLFLQRFPSSLFHDLALSNENTWKLRKVIMMMDTWVHESSWFTAGERTQMSTHATWGRGGERSTRDRWGWGRLNGERKNGWHLNVACTMSEWLAPETSAKDNWKANNNDKERNERTKHITTKARHSTDVCWRSDRGWHSHPCAGDRIIATKWRPPTKHQLELWLDSEPSPHHAER